MSIDEVSRELGRLAAAVEALGSELREHKDDQVRCHETIQASLDCLLAKENQRKGMLQQAKTSAKIWGSVVGAAVVGVFEIVKAYFFGA